MKDYILISKKYILKSFPWVFCLFSEEDGNIPDANIFLHFQCNKKITIGNRLSEDNTSVQ